MIRINRNERTQARLLERYWAALRRDRNATPPSALDPEIAALAARLQEELRPRDARVAFLNGLEQRLHAEAMGRLNRPAWARPSVDRRRPPRLPADESDIGTPEETRMSNVTGTPGDHPVPISQRIAREWLKIAAAIVVFAVLGAALIAVFRDNGDEAPAVSAPASTPTTTAASTPAPTATAPAASAPSPTTASQAPQPTATRTPPTATPAPPQLAVGTEIDGLGTVSAVTQVGPYPRDIVVAAGSVWMIDGGDGQLYELDPATGEIRSTTRISDPPASSDGEASITYGADSLWVTVAGSDTILRQIDPATRQIVAETDLGFGAGVVRFGGGSVWAIDPYGSQSARVDPATHTVAAIEVQDPNNSIAFTDDAAWIPIRLLQLQRIDLATNTVVETIDLHGAGWPLITFGNNIWVGIQTEPGTLKEIDPTTNAVEGIHELGQSRVWNLVVEGDSLWVMTHDADTEAMSLLRFSPSGEQLASIALPSAFQSAVRNGIAAADGVLWLSLDDGRVVRITLS